ncbi:glycosyltransferase family 25 protein [Photorhabdus sp. RM323S]|uniref:glycosyltransferase family 25 protein n=1 Tax=Photorhabdus sp. RM323S TaxID=3342828 RepID=UPI0036DE12EF
MKTFIINLKHSIERRKRIEEQCIKLNLDYEFIEAVDGRLLSQEELQRQTRELSDAITLGEIGCALSHIKIYRNIVENNIPMALILEDDVILNERLPEFLNEIQQKKIIAPSAILLSKASQYFERSKYKLLCGVDIKSVLSASLTCGYILNNQAAKNLIDFLYPVWLVADRWEFFRENGVIKLCCTVPVLVTESEDAVNTTISGRDSEHNIKAGKIWKDIRKRRPFSVKIKNILWKIFVRKIYKIKKD